MQPLMNRRLAILRLQAHGGRLMTRLIAKATGLDVKAAQESASCVANGPHGMLLDANWVGMGFPRMTRDAGPARSDHNYDRISTQEGQVHEQH